MKTYTPVCQMVLVGAIWVGGASANALAQCGSHVGMGGHNPGAVDSHANQLEHHLPNGARPKLVPRTPHHGVLLETGDHILEVVYLPREVRVYLFAKSGEPQSVLTVHGEMTLQHTRGDQSASVRLQHVPANGPQDQDYLAAAVEIAQLPDQTPLNFRFENLPRSRAGKAEFTPLFSRSEIRPYVSRVSLVPADRTGLARQRTCPVTGVELGTMGPPVKVLMGDTPLYLCCAACIEKATTAAAPTIPPERTGNATGY